MKFGREDEGTEPPRTEKSEANPEHQPMICFLAEDLVGVDEQLSNVRVTLSGLLNGNIDSVYREVKRLLAEARAQAALETNGGETPEMLELREKLAHLQHANKEYMRQLTKKDEQIAELEKQLADTQPDA